MTLFSTKVELVLLPLLQPSLDKSRLLSLHILDALWWEGRVGLVREDAILIPVVDCVRDEDEWLTSGALALFCALIKGMHSSRSPRVDLAINESETRVGYIIAPVLVDSVSVRWRSPVEGIVADQFTEWKVDQARQDGLLVRWDTRTGLEISPLCAILVWPEPP